jgi:hypothetical protein
MAGLIWAPERLPSNTITEATVEPKTSATSVRASKVEVLGIKKATTTEPGPINTRVYVPSISERHSLLQLEQGKEEVFT